MPGLFEQSGAQAQKPSHYAPLFIESFFVGLFTNRCALTDPSGVVEKKFYGGRPGSLIGGINTEVTIRNTIGRRPGLSAFSTATYPTAPNRAFSFELLNGQIQVLIDTGSSAALAVSSVGVSSGGVAAYVGTFPAGGSSSYAGLVMQIAGFSNANNNGIFICSASTTTTLTLSNAIATAETLAATAVTSGAVYWDQQNGVKQLLFAKQPGAGQTCFQAVAGISYQGDGVSTWTYTPGNPNGVTWNWGIVAPTTQPKISVIPSGAASVNWAANTIFGTMGLIFDTANSAIYQLNSVNASGTNTTQFGLTGNGQPAWNQTPGATTSDNTIVWKNSGPIVLWTANTTYSNASVGGTAVNPCIIYDGVTKSCYINADPSNAAGKSGPSYPSFKAGVGQATHDGGVKWFYIGTPGLPTTWKAGISYPLLGSISNNDVVSSVTEPTGLQNGLPTNQTIYWQTSGGGTSGASATSPFSASTKLSGVQTSDGDLIWLGLGSGTWAATTAANAWSANGTAFSAIKDANGNFQVCTQTGITGTVVPGTSYVLTAAANASGGQTVYTGTFSPTMPVSTATVTISTVIAGFTTTANNGTFKVISCTSTQLTVSNAAGVAETHAGTAVYNPFATGYGSTTKEGSAIWTCVGTATGMTWTGSTKWYLPIGGFAPPSSSQPYGGASVIDSNSNVQFVINSGKSGGSAPTWLGINLNTTDNTITWFDLEAFSVNSLSWTKGYVYSYAFKARATSDFYSTADSITNSLPVPPGLQNALPAAKGSLTGDVSSASPVFTITGSDSGAVNTISGTGSTDPQVDTIVVFRSADGGGSGQMFELTEISAPKAIGGIAQSWSFQDYLPDTPTALYPGLNPLIPAPIDGVNNPPPSNARPMAYNFQRIWCASGQQIIFSGGPDTLIGNPNAAFSASDEFPYLSKIVRAVKTTAGLVCFTTNSIEIILGGPLTSSFYTVTLAPGIGMAGFNALDIYSGEIFFLDTIGQLRVLSPSLSLSSAGFPISDQLELFSPATAYVAFYDGPNDTKIFVGTGSTAYNGSTGYFAMNPRQIPGSANGPEPVWSPFAAITGGCQMLQSVEVSAGVKKLLVGSTAANQSILERNTNVFTDNGSQYPANFQIGSIRLANRGELALLKFLEFDFAAVTTNPTTSFLLNEINGSFTNLVQPVFDPPSIYGTTLSPSSYNPLRFYFLSTAHLARCVHLQIGCDFGTTPNADEVFNLTVYGSLVKNQ